VKEELMSLKNRNKKYVRDVYRGINGFKMDYHPRSNLVKEENGE
jgi:hypothetical protein